MIFRNFCIFLVLKTYEEVVTAVVAGKNLPGDATEAQEDADGAGGFVGFTDGYVELLAERFVELVAHGIGPLRKPVG